MNIEFLYKKSTDYKTERYSRSHATITTETYLNVELTTETITINPYQKITTDGEKEVDNPEHRIWSYTPIRYNPEPEPDRTLMKSYVDKETKKLSPIIYKSGRLCNLDHQSTERIERIVYELCKKKHITDIIAILKNHYGIFTEDIYFELFEKLKSYYIRLFNDYIDRGYSVEQAKEMAVARIKQYKQIIDNNRKKFRSMNLDDEFDKI